jgi:hypothetical protein
MSFRFRVNKVWHLPQHGICHLIGVVEEGKILPPVRVRIVEHPGQMVRIDSQALGGPLPNGQITLAVSDVTIEPHALEGCHLCDT